MKRMTQGVGSVVIAFGILAGALATGVQAQQDPRPPAPDSAVETAERPRLLVTGIAGSTIYLSFESDDVVIDSGQLLEVAGADEGPTLGRLVVLESVSGRVLTRFESDPFPVTRGAVLYLASASPVLATGPAAPAQVAREAEREDPIVAATRGRGRTTGVSGPRLSGFFALESDLRRSSSHFVTATDGVFGGSDGTIERTFVTPGARLRATLAGLPGGARVHASLRAYDRRRVSRRPVDESQFQLFEAYVAAEPEGAPLRIKVGRFLNPHEAFRGYWDGGLVRLGSDRFGVGASVGWEPAIREQGLNQDLFKYGAFLTTETGSRGTRYSASASATRVDPQAGDSERTILGVAQRLTTGPFRLYANVEAERDTASNAWLISRLHTGATLRAGRVTLRTNASRLRGPVGLPFDTGLDPRRFTSRTGPSRDRLGGGLSLRLGGGSIGGDATLSRDRQDRMSRTYAGHLLLPRTLPGDVALRLNGFYWEDDRANEVVSGAIGFSRRFGRIHADVGYRIDRSERSGFSVTSHGLQIGLSVRGSTGWNYAMSGFARRGADLETDRLYTRLSKSF